MAFELIETIEVGSGGASSIEFTSIPQDGVDLVVKLSGRTTIIGAPDVWWTLNSDSGSNYSTIRLGGTGASVFSVSATTTQFITTMNSRAEDTASTFGNAYIYISNYTSNTSKSLSADGVTENNDTQAYQVLSAGSYSTSSGISTVTAKPSGGGDFVEYSTASLYKIS